MRFVPLINSRFLMARRDRWSAVRRAGWLVLTGMALGACGGTSDTPTANTTEPPINPAPVTPGLLGLTITGLPAGTSADVSVVGPNAATFSRTATGSVGWTDVPPGRYTVTVRPIRAASGTFAATPATQAVTVTAAGAAALTIAYKPLPSALALEISGLPGGAAADVAVTPPRGTPSAVSQSVVLTAAAQDGADATPDRWQVTANEVTSGGTRYLPTPAAFDSTLRLGDTARVAVRYGVGSGAIAVAIGGLPAGVNADATLIAPDNSTRAVTGTATFTGLAAGRYKLVTRALTHAGLRYVPSSDTLPLDVSLSLVATPATITYVAQAGRLSVTVNGVPNGSNANLTLTGPTGSRTLTGSTTIDSLAVGSYTLTGATITSGVDHYAPTPASQPITIAVGATATASVTYALASTAVEVAVTGLPDGVAAAITLTNPAGNTIPVNASTTVNQAAVGRWRLTASDVVSGGSTYSPTPTSYDQTVALGERLALPVQYAVSTGSIALVVAGLPQGANGAVTVTGPRNYSTVITSTTTLTNLPPGTYTVTSASVTINGNAWNPAPVSQTVSVSKSLVAAPATVTYTLGTGSLALTVNGIGAGSANITVTGPGGFTQTVTGTTTLSALPPGNYTISAASVTSAGNTFTAAPASQIVTITSSGTPVPASVTYTQTTGSLALAVTGLPGGASGNVTITGPNAFSRALTGTTTLTGLAPGTYTVSATNVTITGNVWSPAPPSQTVTVTTSAVAAPATVAYAQNPGALALTVSGLPSASAAVTVTGPNSFSQAVTATTTLSNLSAGTYTITAANVTLSSNVYAPSTTSQTVTVSGGATATATVSYSITTGSLAITVNGVPGGSTANITVTGPNAYSRAVTASTTLATLTPGTYTVSASAITNAGNTFTPTAATQTITVSASVTAASATVTYAQSTGSLALAVTGLPGGANGAVTITGPNAYSQSFTGTTTITGLTPGTYTVAASNVTITGNVWSAAPASQTVTVTTSPVAAPATVSYAQNPGSLALTVNGLPSASAAITVTGPNSFSQAVTATTTLSNLSAGTYTITASNVTLSGNVYAPNSTSQTVTVSGGATASASVTYSITTGSLTVTVSGVPGGSTGNVTVTGPNAYSRAVTATTTLSTLTPGTYTISAASITNAGNTFAPTPASQTVTVSASPTAATATVTYAQSTGSLALAVTGLPGGSSGAVTITGPNAYSQNFTATTTLTGLTPGAYTVTASNVTVTGTTYAPSPSSQSVTVTTSPVAAGATVAYAAQGGGGGVNYTINNVYLTQAIQKPDGSVSLVANRDALLRVFVTASGANTAQPQVRVRIYDGATLVTTTTINAPETSVRTANDEGTLSSTWNYLVPAANVKTTLKVLVDLDPTQVVPDSDRTDNSWPLNGTPKAITVATAPTFTVRFVPMTIAGLTGNVSAANKDQFLVTAKKVWPIQNVVSDVRATFTSSATALQSDDANGQWGVALSEMNTLRVTDGAPSTMHYYGVLKVNYTSGVAGYGYQPGRAAIGWDYLPSGDGVAAHEWGHNFSRAHAPCGVAGDPNYPYAGAIINYWGWNSGTNTLVSPNATDLMSYCSNNWVSDYNWTAVLNYRATSGLQAAAVQAGTASAGPQDGLLVWGRVVNGAIQLEPAFRVTAPITPAATRPTHRLDLLDDAGNALLQLPIEAAIVDHVEGREERQFAVVVPYSAAVADRLQQIRVADQRAPLRSVARRATLLSPAAMREAGVQKTVVDSEPGESIVNEGGRVRVSWRNTTYGMAMVRDATSGQIMGYVRQQGAAVNTAGRRVEVVFSDGVRSAVKGFR
jgi:hypothetical protein